MSEEITLIRNPDIYKYSGSDSTASYPIELVDGDFCPVRRNARTEPFQTHYPYTSESQNINRLITYNPDPCSTPIEIQGCLYKSCEDICGNQYHLYKDYTDEQTILEKAELGGQLYINGGQTIGDLDLTGVTVYDTEVYFGIIYIKTDSEIYVGNCLDQNFCKLDYSSVADSYYVDGSVYVWLDQITGDHNLYEFSNGVLNLVTDTPLIDVMTSFDIRFSGNHFELIYVDSVSSQRLTFAEYEYSTRTWSGFTLPVDYPHDIVGTHFNGSHWTVFHQTADLTISGICVRPLSPTEINTPVENKGDLYLTYP